MKVLIVEDEPLAAERLVQLIHRYEPHIQVIDILDTVEATVQHIKKGEKPDLVFLDIQLADGLSFRIFDQVSLDIPLVFITAYDAYAIKAFKLHSVDYLLKPLSYDDLAEAMDKFVKLYWKKTQKPSMNVHIQALREALLDPPKTFKKRFVVKKGEHIHPIPVEDILFFYSEDKATLFKTLDNQRFLLDETLNDLEEKVDPAQFFRLNRKYLCRFSAILDIVAFSQRRLKISLKHAEEEEILISREKVQQFRQWLDR